MIHFGGSALAGRRFRLLLALAVVVALTASSNVAHSALLPPVPKLPPPAPSGLLPSGEMPQALCQPDPQVQTIQKLSCRYGPLVVTPGSNLILFGPVTIESPRADGFITRFEPNLVDALTGEVPAIHEVHLHHGVWLNPAKHGAPFFATGEEKTVSQLPPGYGYPTAPTDAWILNYMLHNLTSQTFTVNITYELDWIARSSPQGSALKTVEPIWMDVVGGFYPVYDPTRETDGTHERTRSFAMAKNYEIVAMAGHVHPGGLRDDVRVDCKPSEAEPAGPADNTLVFSSEAKLNPRGGGVPDPRAFGSWDYLMTATPQDWRLVLNAGDRLEVTSVYDTEHPWYEAMGIVFGWGNPLAPGEQTSAPYCSPPSSASGGVTNDVPPQAVFGGDTTIAPDPSTRPASGPPVTDVTIAAFDYAPGGLGQPPAPVTPGSRVRFNNWDAAASIFHTVTTCKEPCNRNYGQSYPLPEWGYDSRQLGFGPPGATAAANTPTYALDIPADANDGDTFTFFCRIHPFMRGALKVDPDASGTVPQPPIVPSPPSTRSRISSVGFQYVPPTLSIPQGSFVDYTNADPVPHNVTSTETGADGQPLFQSNTVTANVAQPTAIVGTETLEPGSHQYYCTIHPFMLGTIQVSGSGIPPPGPAPPLPPLPGTGSVPAPTSITVRDGSLYAASAGGVIYQLPILPDGALGQAVPYAAGFVLPLGIAFGEDGTLFVADSHPSLRSGRQTEGRVSAVDPVTRLPTTVVDGLPNGRHATNGLAVHDGRLYISNGNSTDDGVEGGSPEEPLSGTLLSVPVESRGLVVGAPDAPLPPGLRVDAVGMRNLYDVAFRPSTDEAWIPMNGLDAQEPYGEDLLLKADIADADIEDFGFPGCVYSAADGLVGKQNRNPAVTDLCDGTEVPPEALLGLHVSSNGLAFGPDGYLYIALYGNNPGEVSAGHKVIRLPISAEGAVSGPQEVVVDGGSPLDVAFGPAGLYVADFASNTITLVRP